MSFLKKLFGSAKKQINLTMCGLDQAGKTTLINYLVHGEFRSTIPTMGVNREMIEFPKVSLNIFDLGGQIDFRALWGEINEKSNALIYVVDSTDYLRFEETKKLFYEIINNQIDQNIPVLILLNKIDLPDGMRRVDFVKDFDLMNIELEINWAVFETSAKTGEGVLESFQWYVQTLEEM